MSLLNQATWSIGSSGLTLDSAGIGGLLAFKSLKKCKTSASPKDPYENSKYQKEGREYVNSWFKKRNSLCQSHQHLQTPQKMFSFPIVKFTVLCWWGQVISLVYSGNNKGGKVQWFLHCRLSLRAITKVTVLSRKLGDLILAVSEEKKKKWTLSISTPLCLDKVSAPKSLKHIWSKSGENCFTYLSVSKRMTVASKARSTELFG